MKRHWSLLPPVAWLAYALLRVVLMIVQMFPHERAPLIGRWLGRCLRTADRKHLRIATRNVQRAAVVPEDQIAGFLDRVYDQVGLALVEILMAPRLLASGRLAQIVRLRHLDVLDRMLADGRGAIIALGHQGNYELAGLAMALAGYPPNSLARPLVNPWIDGYLTRWRVSTGQRVIPREAALSQMVRVLRRNEILAVQIDLDAKRSGILIDFFGRPASTHHAPALLSLRYDAPVVLVDIYREGGTHYVVYSDPILPARFRECADPARAMMEFITARFEASVRAHPDQWLWLLDRWRGGEKASSPAMAAAHGP